MVSVDRGAHLRTKGLRKFFLHCNVRILWRRSVRFTRTNLSTRLSDFLLAPFSTYWTSYHNTWTFSTCVIDCNTISVFDLFSLSSGTILESYQVSLGYYNNGSLRYHYKNQRRLLGQYTRKTTTTCCISHQTHRQRLLSLSSIFSTIMDTTTPASIPTLYTYLNSRSCFFCISTSITSKLKVLRHQLLGTMLQVSHTGHRTKII